MYSQFRAPRLVKRHVRCARHDHVGPLDRPLGAGQVPVGLAGHQNALRASRCHLDRHGKLQIMKKPITKEYCRPQKYFCRLHRFLILAHRATRVVVAVEKIDCHPHHLGFHFPARCHFAILHYTNIPSLLPYFCISQIAHNISRTKALR